MKAGTIAGHFSGLEDKNDVKLNYDEFIDFNQIMRNPPKATSELKVLLALGDFYERKEDLSRLFDVRTRIK